MKRVLLLLVVLVLLIGGAVFFFSRHGVSDGAQLLPVGSAFYVTVPDVQRTMNRWPKTALAQIGAEPSVSDFLGKPLAQVFASGGADALDLLFRVKPDRLFLALPTLSPTGTQVVLGFEYFGGRKDLDAAMDRLYHELAKRVPNSTTTTGDYKGDAVTTFAGSAPIIYSGSHGSWGFIANTEEALRQLLDRAAGRDSSASLASAAGFKTVLGHLSKDPDFLWYGHLDQVLDLLIAVGKKQQATANTKQFDQLRKIKAIGGTLLFDGLDQKEVTYLLYPEAPRIAAIDRAPMALTSPDTMVFYDAAADWKTLSSDDYLSTLPPGTQSFLSTAKIDLKQLPQIFGSDIGFLVNWSPNDGIPTALLSLELKDRARAESLVGSVFTAFGLPNTPSQSKGASVFSIPGVKIAFVEPSLAISDKSMLISVSTPSLDQALSIKPGAPTLEGSASFKSALSGYQDSVQAFGYVDARALFERVYNLIRPIAIIAGAMSPSVNKVVDVSKLPETEAISKHLNPILYSNKQLSDGMLIESSGPITLTQAAALIGGGVGGAYMSKILGSGN